MTEASAEHPRPFPPSSFAHAATLPLRMGISDRIGFVLNQLSAWLFLGCLFVAPWAWGSLPPKAIYSLLTGLGVSVIFWMASLLLLRRRPIATYISIPAALLLIQGWIMAGNPVSGYDAARHIFWSRPHLSWLPGSVDGFSSILSMASFTVLFFVFHMVLDHCRGQASTGGPSGSHFRRLLLWTSAVTGASIAAMGGSQHLVLLAHHKAIVATTFGPFSYHANASSLLLMTIPCAAALTLYYLMSARRFAAAAAGILALVLVAGLLLNSTRAADLIGMAMCAVFGLACVFILQRISRRVRRNGLHIIMAFLLVAAATFVVSLWLMPDKWRLTLHQLYVVNPRMVLWRIVARIALDAGAFGYGPGSFALVFPVSPHFNPQLYGLYILTFHTPGQQVSMWSNAHQDLLQSIVEWGWLGGAIWALLAVSTLVAAFLELRNIHCPAATRILLLAPFTALLAVFLHSTLDFPLQLLTLQLFAVSFAAMVWSARPGKMRPSSPQLPRKGASLLR